jgi:hypothetical protein
MCSVLCSWFAAATIRNFRKSGEMDVWSILAGLPMWQRLGRMMPKQGTTGALNCDKVSSVVRAVTLYLGQHQSVVGWKV